MRLSSKNFNHLSQRTARFYRVAFYVVTMILAIQLFGAGHHKHDLTEISSDCVSCDLAAHLPSGIPPVSIDVAPTLTIFYYYFAALPLYFFISQKSYLIPHSQAPPPRIPSL
jgi:hypothetical protein